MKKTINCMYIAAISLLLLTNACKKNPAPATGETTAAVQQGGRAGSDLPAQPNATVDISEPLFNELNRGTAIEIKKVSESHFVAQRALPNPGTVVSSNPCAWANMWAAYNAYIAANLATFQSWANQMCQPYMGCWCHPTCGLCVMFAIQPTKRCPQIAYQSPVKAFA